MDGYNIRQVITRFRIDMAKYPRQLELADVAEKELHELEAAQQSVQADICPTCRGTGKIYGEFDFIYCSKCGGKGKCR